MSYISCVVFKNLSPRSLLSIQSATDIMPVREVVFLTLNYIYRGVFWTGPPDLQYQNEKQVAANQD